MPRAAHIPWATITIGVGYGLVAGLVGIGQWILVSQDLAARLAAFYAVQRAVPGFFDETNVVRGNEWYWLGTALVAAAVMLVLCLLAAFTAGWVSAPELDTYFAAWVAAGLATITYVIATTVSVAASLAPDMTQSIVPCECPVGLVFGCLILALAPSVAERGQDIGAARLRGCR